MASFVISVLVADRVGILRDISAAVADMGARLDGLSQTVVDGYFTVILTASLAGQPTTDKITQRILANFEPDEASVVVRKCQSPGKTSSPAGGECYILIINGPNRPETVKTVTAYLADHKINIEDWSMNVRDNTAMYIGEVTVPAVLDVKQVQDELCGLLSPKGLAVSFQHENIFRATNEVGAISTLLAGRDVRR